MGLVGWTSVVLWVVGVDVVLDTMAGASTWHLAGEHLVVVSSALLGGSELLRLRRQRAVAAVALREAEAAAELARARATTSAAEAAHWRAEADHAVRDLGRAIDHQFERWGLTAAEAEVALLLLKGLSTKEIAQVRDTSDTTVRQQARTVYGKAGLAGRAELAAWFLEDLLAPRTP